MSGSIGNNPYRASGVVAALAEGRTGTVDWDTTPKTGTVTAESAVGYFINTTSGGITVNLPAGAAGSIVAIADYTRTFNTNNCTVTPNGSDKMGGGDAGGSVTLSVNGQSATFVYVDGTEGWINVQETESSQVGPTSLFVTATGGTPCTGAICGDFKTHVFTGPGTFCVSCAGNACGSTTVDYLVSAGGGGAGGAGGGGAGGAGGFRLSNSVGCIAAPVMSPLANPTGITVSATGYPIVVGGGGAGGSAPPGAGFAQGATSSFSTISSAGGGLGYGGPPSGGGGVGGAGGSGGGGRGGPSPGGSSAYSGGAGDTPNVTPDQGFAGGNGWDGWTASTNGGGGGGAAAVGANSSYRCGGCGGIGSYLGDAFFGPIAPSYGTPGPVSSTRYFSGGGGGATDGPAPVGATGGTGGAGGGGDGPNSPGCGGPGTTNTGGGGGGAGQGDGGTGGPGIVAIRYKFQ